MKTQNFIAALMLLLAAKVCSAQSLFTGNVQIANLSQARGMAACKDGGFGVAGDVYTTQSSSVFLTKLNASGAQQWSTNVSRGGTQFPIAKASVISLADSGFLVSTIQNITDSLYIIRINKSGTIIWAKNVSYAFEVSMIQSSDGGFLIVAAEGSASNNRIIMHKLDFSGTSQWDMYYESYSGYITKPCVVYQNINGDYTITSDGNTGVQKQISIIRIQSNGTLVWAKRYQVSIYPMVFTTFKMKEVGGGNLDILVEAQIFGLKSKIAKLTLTSSGTVTGLQDDHLLADTGMHVSSALFTQDGGFAFAGYKLQSSTTDSWVLKFDSLENFAWGELFPVANTHEYTNQLVQTSTALAFCAWQLGGGAPYSARVSKISFSGQSACAVTPFAITDSAYGIIETNDTILTGTYMSSYSAPYILLTGTTASISCTTGIEDNETGENDFTIAPDPAGEYIFINPGHFTGSRIAFEIYDMRGRLVRNTGEIKTNEARQVKINISRLARGMYVLTARSESQIMSRKFLK